MSTTPNFNRLARVYRWMEWCTFGPLLQRCRCTFLSELRTSRNALIYGDGDGRFTARLLEENANIRIDAVDASQAMLRALLRNAGDNAARVTVHHADARQWQPPHPPCDLIVTHFFLDCLTTEEITALAARLRANAKANICWVVSDFAIPPGILGSLVARPLVSALYLAFKFLTGLRIQQLPDHAQALAAAGFILTRHHTLLAGLLLTQLWISSPQASDQQAVTSGTRPASPNVTNMLKS